MGKQLIDPMVGMSLQPLEHVLGILPRIVPVQPGRLHQAHHHGSTFAGEFAAKSHALRL